MEFPINTQEEFDAAVAEQYGDVANFQQQIQTLTGERDGHAKTITDLRNQIKGHELTNLKMQIAHEKKLPFEMASRLTGDTADDIRKDADAVAKMIRSAGGAAPLFDPSPADPDPKTASMASMLSELRGE